MKGFSFEYLMKDETDYASTNINKFTISFNNKSHIYTFIIIILSIGEMIGYTKLCLSFVLYYNRFSSFYKNVTFLH